MGGASEAWRSTRSRMGPVGEEGPGSSRRPEGGMPSRGSQRRKRRHTVRGDSARQRRQRTSERGSHAAARQGSSAVEEQRGGGAARQWSRPRRGGPGSSRGGGRGGSPGAAHPAHVAPAAPGTAQGAPPDTRGQQGYTRHALRTRGRRTWRHARGTAGGALRRPPACRAWGPCVLFWSKFSVKFAKSSLFAFPSGKNTFCWPTGMRHIGRCQNTSHFFGELV